MAKSKNGTDGALKQLRDFGLNYPGVHLKSPWPGHKDLAVNDKTFAYLSIEGEPFGISCKLPHSAEVALMMPFCTPTGYGLGKSGWVSAKLAPGQSVDVEMFKAWIDESYRAQAPKKLIKELDSKRPEQPGDGAATSTAKAPKKPQKKPPKPTPSRTRRKG